MKNLLIRDLSSQLNITGCAISKREPEYLNWIGSNLTDIADEFVRENNLLKSYFVKNMNIVFKTTRFELLLQRWVVEYLLKLFNLMNDSTLAKQALVLEDCYLNRFGVNKYYSKFGTLPEIEWRPSGGLAQKIFSILVRSVNVLYISLNKGLRISGKTKKYKIMREAIWGLYDFHGYYYHDDFLVDNVVVEKHDLLLFSRGIPTCRDRLKGYQDAKKSSYAHFNLYSLSISLKTLFFRVIPKYIFSATKIFFQESVSGDFSLYWSVYSSFIYNALPYEKIFSNFEIVSELGHNYFSVGHIAEAVICQNYGARYYLMHWSDNSVPTNKFLLSFLGCDKFLIWGNAHACGIRGHSQITMPTGYVFKRFIKEIMFNKSKILSDMGIDAKGKIISFFDETFGEECYTKEGHIIVFWETALKLAETEKDSTVLVKPKELEKFNNLSRDSKRRFMEIKSKIESLPNMHIIDSYKWSFMEVVGVSDVVVTQGMSSSATIAIICGVEGLYLDMVQEEHPFSKLFKDRIVFYDPEKLLSMIQRIIKGLESPLKDIPKAILTDYDAYRDDCGIERFRRILTGNNINQP